MQLGETCVVEPERATSKFKFHSLNWLGLRRRVENSRVKEYEMLVKTRS